ncbi:MAG: hypothetical protein EB127_11060 [Alphaproteobacteria bacterium]|nr:hypothetical protein [Alphaproteobacteria bacterium]
MVHEEQTWDHIQDGFKFGKKHHGHPIPFLIRFLSLAIPGAFLGHYVDQAVLKVQRLNLLGTMKVQYVFFQLFLWAGLFYALFVFAPGYTKEFQRSIAGIFFIALFFSVQPNFVANLQFVLGVVDREF